VLGLVSALIVFVLAVTTATGSFAWTTGSGGHGGGQGGGHEQERGEGQDKGGGEGKGEGQGGGQGSGDGSVEAPPSSDQFAVAAITGQTSFIDITEATGIPASAFVQVFGVPEDAQPLPMSRTKDAYGFKPGEIRYFVELYLTDPAAALDYVPGTFEH
jgi:hypothetical protein